MAEEVEEMYENSYCRIHPGQSTVGICALCLQEKLGKLIFSEKQTLFPHQSEVGSSYSCSSSSSEAARRINGENHEVGARAKVMGLKENGGGRSTQGGAGSQDQRFILLSRSKSVAASRRVPSSLGDSNRGHECTHVKKKGGSSFWSFLYFTKKKSSHRNGGEDKNEEEEEEQEEEEEKKEVGFAGFDGKVGGRVMRSRSVGYGSKSFGAERFGHGHEQRFVRRSPIGSERRGLDKASKALGGEEEEEDEVVKGGSGSNVRCGGLFVGFGGLPASVISEGLKDGSARANGCHSRSRSWGWAFSSPIRAFRHSKRWSSSNNFKSSNEDPDPAVAASSPPGSAMEIDRG